ncbi:MAG: response regulator transcription factor [Chloroflexi bacterium]|nr:response regulator transcription factor [Chloroflexota bacterium]
MEQYHILVVDDDEALANLLEVSLRSAAGYQVDIALDGETALALWPKLGSDLIILDLMMPGLDGFAVLAGVRRSSRVPVLVLSARHKVQDRIRALNEGADDYLTKPFEMEELLARVNALLRRAPPDVVDRSTDIRNFGDLCIDPERRCVTLRGNRLHLTPTEYAILAEFATCPDQVLTHSKLFHRIWGSEYHTENHYLHVYIQRLRSKIEDDPANPRYIVTEPGVGYRFCSGIAG